MAEMRSQTEKEVTNSSFDKLDKITERFSAKMKQGFTEVFDSYRSSLQFHQRTDLHRSEVPKVSPMSNRILTRRREISWEEFNERRLLGLCEFCGEPVTPDHHLKHKNIGVLMISGDEDQSCVEDDLVDSVVAIDSGSSIQADLVPTEATLPSELDSPIHGSSLQVSLTLDLGDDWGGFKNEKLTSIIADVVVSLDKDVKLLDCVALPLVQPSSSLSQAFSYANRSVWEPGGFHCVQVLENRVQHQSNKKEVEEFVVQRISDVIEMEKQAVTTAGVYGRQSARVWEPGGLKIALNLWDWREDKWKGFHKCHKRGKLLRLLLGGSDCSTKVSDNFDHNHELTGISTSLSKSSTGSITIFRIEKWLCVVSLLCFMGISFWTTVLWYRKTRKKKITSWWHWEEWLGTYMEFTPLFDQTPKELSPAVIKWLFSSNLVHKIESEIGFEANSHVSMRLLLWETTKDVIAELLQCVKMRIQAHMDLFGSNSWVAESCKRKLRKTWSFKFKQKHVHVQSNKSRGEVQFTFAWLTHPSIYSKANWLITKDKQLLWLYSSDKMHLWKKLRGKTFMSILCEPYSNFSTGLPLGQFSVGLGIDYSVGDLRGRSNKVYTCLEILQERKEQGRFKQGKHLKNWQFKFKQKSGKYGLCANLEVKVFSKGKDLIRENRQVVIGLDMWAAKKDIGPRLKPTMAMNKGREERRVSDHRKY